MSDDVARLERELADARERARALETENRALREAQFDGFGTWYVDLVRKVGNWSDEAFRAYGYEPGEVTVESSTWVSRVHPEDQERALADARLVFVTGEPYTSDFRVVRVDGEVRHVRTRARLERDTGGRPVMLYGTVQDITERIRTEAELLRVHEALSGQAQQLDDAQKLAGLGHWTADPTTGTGEWSSEMYRIYGVDPEVAIDTENYRQWIHPEDLARMDEAWEKTFRTGVGHEIEYRTVRPDGEERTILARHKVVRQEDGHLTLAGTAQDVTQMRRAQREALDAQELLKQLLTAATDTAIVGTDRMGVVTIFNRGAEAMLGWAAEEMLGLPAWQQIHDLDEIPRLLREFQRQGADWILDPPGGWPDARDGAQAEDDPDEWTYIRRDGARLRVHLKVTAMRDSAGSITGFVGIATDVTEHRKAERERDEHAQMLRAVIENNQSIIYVKDLEGRYLLINEAYEKAHGVTEAEMLGSTDEQRYPGLAAMWHANNMKAVDGAFTVEEVADLPDGRHVYEAVKLPLYDAKGEIYAVCGLSLDITQRRRAEADSRAAVEAMSEARDRALAANAAKSAFLATMSHEIRTPMNAVIGLTGLLLDTGLDEVQHDLMETVRSSGDHLLEIINDVLDFSKIEAGELDLESRRFDLRRTVQDTVAQFAASSHVDLSGVVAPGVPAEVTGDPVRIRQVLGNLIGNAVKFTAEGSVDVDVRVEADEGIPAGTLLLRFDVRDTGIGIPAGAMNRLFRSFSQVDASTTRVYGGTGLGLAISRGLAEAMGGTMWVESEVGVGSTFSFTVRVPAEPPAPGEDARGPGSTASTPGVKPVPQARRGEPAPDTEEPRPRVLVAEDNLVNQKVARMILAKLGHRCDVAGNGRLALEAAHAHPYEVVLMDMHMPEMDGLEATRRIRAELPEDRQPYVVAVTASVTQEDREACAAAGMDAYVPKPVRVDDLADALERAFAARAAGRVRPIGSAASGSEQRVTSR